MATEKIAVKSVYLNDAEGYGGEVTFTGPQALKEAEAQLKTWGWHAPKHETGCYSKVDYWVIWENDDEYAGRFDMQYGGWDNGRALSDCIADFLRYLAGVKQPTHMTEHEYFLAVQRDSYRKVEAHKMLETLYIVDYVFEM